MNVPEADRGFIHWNPTISMASTSKLEVSATVLVMLTGSEGTSKKADDFELNNERFNDQSTSFSADRIKNGKVHVQIGGKVGASHEEIEEYITSHPI
jgi:hypothetical protein